MAMEITLKIPEEIAAQARARGISVEAYIEEILARQTEASRAATPNGAQKEAVHEMLVFAQKNSVRLEGLSVKDLIHEGHRL